jgi:hypothetical protein
MVGDVVTKIGGTPIKAGMLPQAMKLLKATLHEKELVIKYVTSCFLSERVIFTSTIIF